jgi:hypothetical protein
MQNKLEITAKTLGEAKDKMFKEIPSGCFLISWKEIKPSQLTKKASADTVDEAINKAKKEIPVSAMNLKENIICPPRKDIVESTAFDVEQAKRLAVNEQSEAVNVTRVDLVKKGSSGLMGFGKKPGVYNVELFYQARVEINYETPAKIIAQITDNKQTAAEKYLDYAEKGDCAMVEFLLKQGVDINARNKNGATALIVSAFAGNHKVAIFLIDQGIDINCPDNGGFTALMVASECTKADKEVVKKLIERGANVNAVSNRGSTALMAAAKIGHADIVELLVSSGADINARNTDHNVTPLIWAANAGYLAIVKFLLQKGADRNIVTNNNYTAASIAKENGYYSVVEVINNYK